MSLYKHVAMKNIRSFMDAEMKLSGLTALVGPNGSGKSTVLDALFLMSELKVKEATSFLMGASGQFLRRIGTSSASRSVIAMSWGDYDARLSFVTEGDRRTEIERASSSVSWKLFGEELEDSGDAKDSLFRAVLFRLNPSVLMKASYSEDEVPTLGVDGEGLASVLAFLSLNNPEAFHRIVEALKQVVPDVLGIRLARERIAHSAKSIEDGSLTNVLVWGDSLRLDMRSGKDLPSSCISEGTLLTLALLTAALGDRHPKVLLIDEVERALHPRAVSDLIGNLRKAQEGGLVEQVVMTTHSPFVLNALEPEEVVIASKKDGVSSLKALVDHPNIEQFREELETGELWSVIGEDWAQA